MSDTQRSRGAAALREAPRADLEPRMLESFYPVLTVIVELPGYWGRDKDLFG